MASGLLTYADRDGNPLVVNMTSRLSQMQGYVDVLGTDGNAVVPKPPAGRTPFYAIAPLADNVENKGKRPGVNFIIGAGTTNTLDWKYSYTQALGAYSLHVRIHYGYY